MSDQPRWVPDPAFVVECEILGKSRVEFTHHAADRMRSRGLTAEQVIDAISSPDEQALPVDQQQWPDAPPRFRVRRLFGGDFGLDVVYEVWPEAIVVVSTYPRKKRLGGRF